MRAFLYKRINIRKIKNEEDNTGNGFNLNKQRSDGGMGICDRAG